MKEKSLGSKAREGLFWNLAGNFLKQFFTVAVSIIIARILGPADYGVIGLAMVFVSFCQVFIDVGFTEGVIQKEKISKTALSSVFIINLVISIVLCVMIILFAPLIGVFLENERVVNVIRYLALILPIAALGKVHAAMLTRDLKIKALSVRDVISAVLGGAAGLITAYNGFGVYSLVWQQLTTTITGTVLLWIGSKWVPQLLFSWSEVKSLLVFSFYVFLDYLMQQFFNKLDTLFVGKVFSATTLGLYSRADSIRGLINDFSTNSLSKIIFPVLSSIQKDPERVKEVFTKTMAFIMVVTTIITGIMFFSAELIIIGLLGEEWRQSVVFFQILIFSTISLPLRAIVFRAILALGYSKLRFRVNVISNIIKLMSIPVGYFFGVEAFAWAVVGGRFVVVVVSWVAFHTVLKFDFTKIIRALLLPVLSLAFWVALYYMHLANFNMLYYGAMFLATHLILLSVTNNYGFFLLKREVASVLNKMRNKWGKKQPVKKQR